MSITAKRKDASKLLGQEFTISPYLKGRIGTVARLDEMTPQEVLTAALISYLDGDHAVGKYLDKLDVAKPPKPWAPFIKAPEGETPDERKVRVAKALRARFPDTDTPPFVDALAFMELLQ